MLSSGDAITSVYRSQASPFSPSHKQLATLCPGEGEEEEKKRSQQEQKQKAQEGTSRQGYRVTGICHIISFCPQFSHALDSVAICSYSFNKQCS